MFSKACEYALRASIIIAQKSDEKHKLSIKQIAEDTKIPSHFMAKILQQLSRGGIVNSTKGPSGGFFVNEEQRQIKLMQIVRLIDGDELFTGCALGLPGCSDDKPCPLHEQFAKIRAEISEMLENTSLEDSSKQVQQGLTFLSR